MYLFFDVSAIGKPKNWKSPASDTFNWPRMMHLSWLLYNGDRELQASSDDIIRPEGFEIPVEAERKHHLTQEQALETGVPLADSLNRFKEVVNKAEYVIAHNMNFNENVVGAEFVRKGITHQLRSSEKYCLMHEATWFCKISAPGGRYKWPTLQEIHAKIFTKRYAQAGNALADVSACTLCFFALLDLKAIELF